MAAALVVAAGTALAAGIEVIDGDTIRRDGVTIRIMGLDAPEVRGKCPDERAKANRATARLRELVEAGVTITPQQRRTRDGVIVEARDRYGRVLATVRDARGRDVADVLVNEGLARRYDGHGQRGGWCPL